MVDVGGIDQCVHGGVDGGCGPTPSVKAVLHRPHHLVFVLGSFVHVSQRTETVQPEHGKATLGQRAQISPGALDPQELDVVSAGGVGLDPLGRGVPTCVVGVPAVCAQSVRAGQELIHGAVHLTLPS